jgi:hypothetical protein
MGERNWKARNSRKSGKYMRWKILPSRKFCRKSFITGRKKRKFLWQVGQYAARSGKFLSSPLNFSNSPWLSLSHSLSRGVSHMRKETRCLLELESDANGLQNEIRENHRKFQWQPITSVLIISGPILMKLAPAQKPSVVAPPCDYVNLGVPVFSSRNTVW